MHPIFMRLLAAIEGTSDKAAGDPYYKTIRIFKNLDQESVIARVDFEAAVTGGHPAGMMAQQFDHARADIKTTLQQRVDRHKIQGFNLPRQQALGTTRDNMQTMLYADPGHLDCYRLGDYLKTANDYLELKNLLARSAMHGESEKILAIATRIQQLPDYALTATARPGKAPNPKYT